MNSCADTWGVKGKKRLSLDKILRISDIFQTGRSLVDVKANALEVVCAILECQKAVLLLADQDHQFFCVDMSWPRKPQELQRNQSKIQIPFSKYSFAQKVYVTGQPVRQEGAICALIQANQEKLGVLYVNRKVDGEFDDDDVQICALLGGLMGQALKVTLQVEFIKEMNDEVFDLVTSMIDAKDEYTAGHSKRVGYYAAQIGTVLGLSQNEIGKLQLGGVLHDIGKIGIHDSILKKPAKLTSQEYEEIMKHPEISAKMLEKYQYFRDVIELAKDHHLRPDGKGYPKKAEGSDEQYKKWEDVTFLSRIIIVADAFDAMWGGRNYQPRKSLPETIQEFRRLVGKQFDAQAVEGLVQYLEQRYGKEALEEAVADEPAKKKAA